MIVDHPFSQKGMFLVKRIRQNGKKREERGGERESGRDGGEGGRKGREETKTRFWTAEADRIKKRPKKKKKGRKLGDMVNIIRGAIPEKRQTSKKLG